MPDPRDAHDILRIVLDEIEGGADMPLTDNARTDFISEYFPAFDRRFKEVGAEGWNKEEKTVKRVADIHGKIAGMLAKLGNEGVVTARILMGVAPIVEQQCGVRTKGEGAWCSGG
ncbi:MAG TPA: hypothetical protein VI485_25045 [Vicinamibacterales bacterium]|nr:hypothetical protein [Vicinamibacterales bacterium]